MVKDKNLEQPAKSITTDGYIEAIEMDNLINKISKENVSIEDMPLENISDYIRYNREARKLNKKLKICRYEIKPCPVELHPTEKIVFNRKDQPTNKITVTLSNDMIDFKKELIWGKE